MLAAVVIGMAGCGGGDDGVAFERGDSPPPERCLKRWNADQANRQFGRHVYISHASRAAQVVEARSEGSGKQCAVIFAVSDSDREFGTVGEVDYSGSWQLMNFAPAVGDPVEAQRRAAKNANARLRADGRLTAFQIGDG